MAAGTSAEGGIRYRRSRAGDAQAVFDLVSASVRRLAPVPYSQEVVDSWMAGRVPGDYLADCASGAIWIAEAGQAPAGFAHGVPGEVKRLFVAAEHTGKGAGAGLMARALADALPEGTGQVRIEATLNAVPFYARWGFAETGRGVFSGRAPQLPEIDVVILEKRF
ncbi:MAG: GNAT family N-acetyltransferase [Leisingera sp.]